METDKPVKILHYCWFGGAPLPKETVEYMKSWTEFLPDFEIMRWDESNFDLDSVEFVRDAYDAKKWAMVSDYVRFYALEKYGGLYLDTDVQMIRGVDDLIKSSFVGFERKDIVAPGLILYAKQPNMQFYSELIDIYKHTVFDLKNINEITSPVITTRLLKEWGLKCDNTLQQVRDVTVYPMEYFNPIGENISSRPEITENTRSIHWFQASWFSKIDLELFNLRKKFGYKIGTVIFVFKHPIAAIKRKFDKNKRVTV